MIVKKIIEPRYQVEMTAEQKELITFAVQNLNERKSLSELPAGQREALNDLRVSLLNTG